MASTSKREVVQQVIHPVGLQRIDFVRQRDGRVLVEEWRWSHENESWYPAPAEEPLIYDTYAEAFALAAVRLEWLAGVFTEQPADSRHGYHLELLRGLIFHLAAVEPGLTSDHYHCDAGWAKLLVSGDPDTTVYGYVTRYVIPLSGGKSQWHWVCDQCFTDLRNTLQWTVVDSA